MRIMESFDVFFSAFVSKLNVHALDFINWFELNSEKMINWYFLNLILQFSGAMQRNFWAICVCVCERVAMMTRDKVIACNAYYP